MPARNSSMDISSPADASTADAEQTGRRKSGRVAKAPQRFTGETAAAKRKRAKDAPEDDDEQDVDMDDALEDDSDEDEGEPDEEELRASRRRKRQSGGSKKAPAKRVKTTANGATDEVATDLAIRPATTRKPAKPRKKKPRFSAIETGGLYGDIFGTGEDSDKLAAAWLERYREQDSSAIAELVNLVLRAAGCTLAISKEDVEDVDNATGRLSDIQEEFQAGEVVDYPLIAKGRQGDAFKRTLGEFVQSLVKTFAAHNAIYENPELMESIHTWIGALSSASSRPFRHTATVVSLEIMTAYTEIGSGLVEARATALRQVEGEKRKARPNQSRVKNLTEESNKLSEKSEKINSLIQDSFDLMFVHRYRDVDPKIRVECIIALGVWFQQMPDLFLDGSHLRYFGWCLSDTVAATRKEVIKGLMPLYEKDDNIGGLRQFTERFRSRMVEMATRDAESDTRAHAVQLLNILREKELLEPSDVDTIGELIYDADPKVREAVVPFFVASVGDMYAMKLEEVAEEVGGADIVDENLPEESDDDFETPRREWLRLKGLAELMTSYDTADEPAGIIERGHLGSVDVLIAAGLDSRYTLAVQSFLPSLPTLKKWEVLAGLLLFDHSSTNRRGANETMQALKQQCKLSEREEIMLLDVLNVSVRSCLADVVDQTAAAKKNKKSKAQQQQDEETRDTAAQRLAVLIPRLLGKFGAEPDAASAVLRLERVLNLEVFQELRQDSTTFSALLDNIKKQFLEHENQFVIAEASAALAHANSYEELEDITSGKMQALWDDTCYNLIAYTNGEDNSTRGSMSKNVLSGLSNTLLRISNLASIFDCTEPFHTARTYKPAKSRRTSKKVDGSPTKPIQVLLELLNRGVPNDNEDADHDATENAVVLHAFKCILFYFLWQSRSLADNDKPDRQAIHTVADRRKNVLDSLVRILRRRRQVDEVRLGAASLLLDLHIAFAQFRSKDGDDRPAALAELAAPVPDQAVEYLLATFAAAERDYARKAKKNINSEPEADEDPIDEDPEDSEADEADADPNDADAARQKQRDILFAEQRFCAFASKLVLALAASGHVINEKSELGKRLRPRLLKNSTRLGPNFKEVCALLAAPKDNKKGSKAKTGAKGSAPSKAASKSAEMVRESDDDDDNDNDVAGGEDEGERDEAAEEEQRMADEQAEADARDEDMADRADNDDEVESIVGD